MIRRGKTALVIGASSPGGLGEAVARRLAADGCRIALAARNEAAAAALAQELGGTAYPCDVCDDESLAAMVREAGPLDIVVNAAGTTCAGGLANIRRAQLEEQMAIHFTANALLLKHVAAAMPDGGAVVLFSSVTARLAGAGLAAYSCAKAALEQLVRVAGVELGERRIRVNAVAPGFAHTPMTEAIFAQPQLRDLYLGHVPLAQRAVLPGEVAAAVAWLVADDCFMTGETMQVSGGAQLGRMPDPAELRELRKG